MYKIQCVLCANRLEYDDIYLLEFENTVNYELVALIYKQRGEVVAKAEMLFERPDDDAEVDILAITRVEDNRLMNLVKKREEEKFIQGMISQNPARKQTMLDNLNQDSQCFKCRKTFIKDTILPNILSGCSHRVCGICLDKELAVYHTSFHNDSIV